MSHSGTANGDTLALGGEAGQKGNFDVHLIDEQYQGFAKFLKTGTSTWELSTSGTVTYNIPVTIQNGIPVVGPTESGSTSFALGNWDVFVTGGVLRTTSLGDPTPPLTINIGRNYTQTGGILQLGIAGRNGSQYDRIQAQGTASVGGALQVFGLKYTFRPVRLPG